MPGRLQTVCSDELWISSRIFFVFADAARPFTSFCYYFSTNEHDDDGDNVVWCVFSANILLGTHFEAKISDFGLAKVATARSEGYGKFTNVTRDEMTDVYGSRAYLPRDFVTNGCKYSVSTDVFSFGVVSLLHSCCSGVAR